MTDYIRELEKAISVLKLAQHHIEKPDAIPGIRVTVLLEDAIARVERVKRDRLDCHLSGTARRAASTRFDGSRVRQARAKIRQKRWSPNAAETFRPTFRATASRSN
jgi:hypothetical protein